MRIVNFREIRLLISLFCYITEEKNRFLIVYQDGRAVVGRLPVTELFLEGLHEPGNPKAIKMVKKAFAVRGYKITEVLDMQSYYYYHVAEIMPYILMCYKVDCDLKKLKRKDIKKIVTASGECFEYLKSVGISVMPVGEDKLLKKV